jgi:tRNA1Val (adenine37-N6)-methyltransferase
MKVTTDACLFGAWCAWDLQGKNTSLGLDVGTGTGLLSLQVAQKNDVLIHAVELEKNAAEQAQKNIADSIFSDKIRVTNADVTRIEFIERYDFIISNPPFYEKELQSPVAARNLAHHSGLSLESLLKLIERNLRADGAFYILWPYKRMEQAINYFANSKLVLHEKLLVAASPTHPPQRVMFKGGFNETLLKEGSLSIKNADQTYSAEFVSLLKDYYLYL